MKERQKKVTDLLLFVRMITHQIWIELDKLKNQRVLIEWVHIQWLQKWIEGGEFVYERIDG